MFWVTTARSLPFPRPAAGGKGSAGQAQGQAVKGQQRHPGQVVTDKIAQPFAQAVDGAAVEAQNQDGPRIDPAHSQEIRDPVGNHPGFPRTGTGEERGGILEVVALDHAAERLPGRERLAIAGIDVADLTFGDRHQSHFVDGILPTPQADVDATCAYLAEQGVPLLFDTPRHRPEFSGDEASTYYQVMFETPDRLLLEVVYIGPKSN